MNNKQLTTRSIVKGWTTRRLFDTPKFIELLNDEGVKFSTKTITSHTLTRAYDAGLKAGLSKKDLAVLLDKSAKPMFKVNALWKFVNKFFKKDLAIPYLFGNWTTSPITANLVTTRGKRIVAEQLNGVSTAPVTAIAIGTGTTAAAAGDTALQTESTTNGGARGAATTSNQTTTTTGDTARWVKTFTFTGSIAVTEEGLFDNNTSGGNMLARQVFSAVNVVNTDTLQITHNVQLT